MFETVTHQVDPRYYFIDSGSLVTREYLISIPKSASPDNKPSGSTQSYVGSYSWYVDETGTVQSLYYFLPDQKGYVDGVFP